MKSKEKGRDPNPACTSGYTHTHAPEGDTPEQALNRLQERCKLHGSYSRCMSAQAATTYLPLAELSSTSAFYRRNTIVPQASSAVGVLGHVAATAKFQNDTCDDARSNAERISGQDCSWSFHWCCQAGGQELTSHRTTSVWIIARQDWYSDPVPKIAHLAPISKAQLCRDEFVLLDLLLGAGERLRSMASETNT